MFYLVESIVLTTVPGCKVNARIVKKTENKEELQEKIKTLYENAIKNIDEKILVNNCSKKDIENGITKFDKNNLLITTLFVKCGLESEMVNYAICEERGKIL